MEVVLSFSNLHALYFSEVEDQARTWIQPGSADLGGVVWPQIVCRRIGAAFSQIVPSLASDEEGPGFPCAHPVESTAMK